MVKCLQYKLFPSPPPLSLFFLSTSKKSFLSNWQESQRGNTNFVRSLLACVCFNFYVLTYLVSFSNLLLLNDVSLFPLTLILSLSPSLFSILLCLLTITKRIPIQEFIGWRAIFCRQKTILLICQFLNKMVHKE